MTTPWVLVPAGEVEPGARIELDRDESLHLRTVLRSRPGDRVVVVDGDGRVGDGVVRTLSRSAVQVEVAVVNQSFARKAGRSLANGKMKR